jgi:quercetin dioxygenase-like cupin family protein
MTDERSDSATRVDAAHTAKFPVPHLKSGPGEDRGNGVRVWSVSGKQMTVNYVEISAGGKTKVDRHTNEQINYILEGEVLLLLGSNPPTQFMMRPGDLIVIKSFEEHQFIATSQTVLFLGIISPAKT